MSGLSPDDYAKTMMTNMSKMVESIGTIVTKLASNRSDKRYDEAHKQYNERNDDTTGHTDE
jgi:hypothetical protein